MAYSQSVSSGPVTVVEVEPFSSKAAKIWTEEECLEFIGFIAQNPKAGQVVSGSGGLRKVRWARQGSGKRGGARVVYFFHTPSMPLFLLTVYAKGRKDNVSPGELAAMKRIVKALKASYAKD